MFRLHHIQMSRTGGLKTLIRNQRFGPKNKNEYAMLRVLRARKERQFNRVYGLETVEIKCRAHSGKICGVIKDISSSGARIRVYDPGGLARKITLSSVSIGEGVAARICWRRGTEIGVQFDTPLEGQIGISVGAIPLEE
jgi:hypothetical protein